MESTPIKEQDEIVEQAVQLLPPEIREQVREFIESLLAEQVPVVTKPKLDWRGGLKDLKEQYTSVELQHKALEWWGD